MAQDHFAVLGLTPGRWTPDEVTLRYCAARRRLTGKLDDPPRHDAAHRQLEELHVAYQALRDPRRQAEYLRARAVGQEPVAELRALIAASLEHGLLRYSRRRMILERARELGINEFQAQLLIAQVQFGEEEIAVGPLPQVVRRTVHNPRLAPRVAAVGILALAMFLYMVHWLGA